MAEGRLVFRQARADTVTESFQGMHTPTLPPHRQGEVPDGALPTEPEGESWAVATAPPHSM